MINRAFLNRTCYTFLAIAMLASFLGCKQNNNAIDSEAVVRVYDKFLTHSELESVISKNKKGIDSTELADRFVQEWVNKELILEKANFNIGDRTEIEEMVTEYRNSLLVSKYLELLVAQKADINVLDQEVAAYYSKNSASFLLDETILSGIYLKIPIEAPKLNLLKTWMKNRSEEDLIELEDYCFQNAQKYEVFNDSWLPISVVSKYLPESNINAFKKGVTIEQSDSLSLYYVLVFDIRSKGATAPLMYVEPQILKILQHKRRLEYLASFKKDILNEALKNKNVEYYEKQ